MQAFLLWDDERPMSLLLEIPLLLDWVQLPQRRLQELSDVADDDSLHAGARLGLRHVVPEQVEGDDGLDACIGPEALEFPRGVQGVRLHDDAAGAEDGEECDDEVRRVREDQGHAVPATDSDLPQAGGKPVGGCVQFSIRDGLPVERDGGAIGVGFRGASKQLVDRNLGILNGLRNSSRPTSKPGPVNRRVPLHG